MRRSVGYAHATDHGAVEGAGSARQHRAMQNQTQQTTTAAAFGRSSIARLPPTLREAVDKAIADGATIDEITARIRAEGGACSRSAVGRYTKNVRDLIRLERERAAAKAARAAPGAGQAPARKGLSPEAVAAIREVVEGRPRAPERAVSSAPVDPWNSAESQLIPLNPGESRSENVSGVSSFKSLNGGRELRSLAYAPFGAAGSRALRTCSPASLMANTSSAAAGGRKGDADGHILLSLSAPGAERAGERWGKSSSNDSDAELLRSLCNRKHR